MLEGFDATSAWRATAAQDPERAAAALARFVALISVARDPDAPADEERPLLLVETHLWLRTLSRVLRFVSQEPVFSWSDDEQTPLAVLTCREWGWTQTVPPERAAGVAGHALPAQTLRGSPRPALRRGRRPGGPRPPLQLLPASEMAQADAQGFLVEHGLLPNYSLVEDGVRLEAMLTFKEPVRTARTEAGKPDAGDAPRTKWSSEPRVHDRPAEAALTELAPGNAYYVRGYRQVIGGFDLGPTRKGSPAGLPVGLRTWRICRECGHVRTGERAEQDTSPCPRCGGHGIGGRSSVFQVAVPRKVTAHDKRDDARITDDRDTRLHIDQSEVGAQVVALPDRTEPTTDDAPRDGSVGASAAPDTPRTEAAAQAPPPTSRVRTPLFARYDDDLLLDLGVVRSLLPALRKVCTGEQFEALLAHNLPELTRDVLLALRDRADPKEVRQCITEKWRAEEDVNPRDFSRAAQRAVSQAETDDDAVLGALGKSFARARDELIVTWSGEASRFLPEDADETVHRATDLLRHDGPSSGSSGSTAA